MAPQCSLSFSLGEWEKQKSQEEGAHGRRDRIYSPGPRCEATDQWKRHYHLLRDLIVVWVEALENAGLGTEDLAQRVKILAVQSTSSSPPCPH